MCTRSVFSKFKGTVLHKLSVQSFNEIIILPTSNYILPDVDSNLSKLHEIQSFIYYHSFRFKLGKQSALLLVISYFFPDFLENLEVLSDNYPIESDFYAIVGAGEMKVLLKWSNQNSVANLNIKYTDGLKLKKVYFSYSKFFVCF